MFRTASRPPVSSTRTPPSTRAAFVAHLRLVLAGTLALAGFAVPMKLSGQPTPWRVLGARSHEMGLRIASARDFNSAAVSITGLGSVSGFPDPSSLLYRGADGQEVTPARIRAFLERQRSPLAPYAAEIVAAGIRYGVDPRVVVAIAGVESTYGIHAWRHNAWGWNAGKARWSSWPDAVDGFTRALGGAYRSLRHGRFAAASRTYCPPCGASWGVKALRIFRAI